MYVLWYWKTLFCRLWATKSCPAYNSLCGVGARNAMGQKTARERQSSDSIFEIGSESKERNRDNKRKKKMRFEKKMKNDKEMKRTPTLATSIKLSKIKKSNQEKWVVCLWRFLRKKCLVVVSEVSGSSGVWDGKERRREVYEDLEWLVDNGDGHGGAVGESAIGGLGREG